MRKVPPAIQIILSICEEPSRTVASGWNVVEGKSAVISSIAFQWIDGNTIWLGHATQDDLWTLLDRGPTPGADQCGRHRSLLLFWNGADVKPACPQGQCRAVLPADRMQS